MRADRHTRLTGALAPNGTAAHTVTSRARRQAETRTALLDAAERLFCSDGYAVTSLERIAGEAGFTKGAIYANFASKEALFLALQERRSRTLGNHWAAELPASASPEVQARAISEHLELARQTIALLDGLAIDASVDPEVDFVRVFSRAFTALVSSARQ